MNTLHILINRTPASVSVYCIWFPIEWRGALTEGLRCTWKHDSIKTNIMSCSTPDACFTICAPLISCKHAVYSPCLDGVLVVFTKDGCCCKIMALFVNPDVIECIALHCPLSFRCRPSAFTCNCVHCKSCAFITDYIKQENIYLSY